MLAIPFFPLFLPKFVEITKVISKISLGVCDKRISTGSVQVDFNRGSLEIGSLCDILVVCGSNEAD